MKKKKNFLTTTFFVVIIAVLTLTVLFVATKNLVVPLLPEESAKEVLKFCNNVEKTITEIFEGKSEKVQIEGVKLSKCGDYEINQYTDFTVPLNWTVAPFESEDDVTTEAIAVMGENIVVTLQLKNISSGTDTESITWTRDLIMHTLSNRYPEYEFEPSMTKERIAMINAKTEGTGTTTRISVIGLGDKTLIITCVYTYDQIAYAEEYFAYLNTKIVTSIE